MPKKLLWGITLTALLLSLTTLSFSQGSESAVKGNLSGVAEDPSGAVVEGAKITIVGPIGSRTAQTGPDGRFLFQVLTPGVYSVKVEKSGFKMVEIKSAEVVTGRTTSIDVKMEVGASSTIVEVTAAAVTVDTTSTALATNLNDTFYQQVPTARGVAGLFYAAPGVVAGGGTGASNPSISGGTGLENNYVADGVSITDGAFGGLGVFSRMLGPLASGINLSFVKEVQVKTGGFEAQYGKSTGGIVQIVTKSGTDAFHGSIGGFFAPQQLEATRKHVDDFDLGAPDQRFNLFGKVLHPSNYDLDAQLGGPVFKGKLFFFGSIHPQWNTNHDRFAQFANPSDLGTAGLAGPTQTAFANDRDITTKVYSYAGKLTFRINDKHSIEGSVFGDPSYGENNPNFGLNVMNDTTFDKLQYGTRNVVGRYNGVFSPTWLVNGSWSWGHNNLSDTPASPNVYNVVDRAQRLPCGAPVFNPDCLSPNNVIDGTFTRQGLGYYENTVGDTYGAKGDTSKIFRFLGEHNLGFGYGYDRGHYDGTKARTGARFIPAATRANGTPEDYGLGTLPASIAAALASRGTDATLQLRSSTARCIGSGAANAQAELYIPGIANCPDGGMGVYLRQTRGEFGDPNFKTTSRYHSAFAQDSWSINKYVTVNAGIRWEQQQLLGTEAHYTFTDNWSPRCGISVDPGGNRKTKVYANFGRDDESVPLDMAIRSLSGELDFADVNYAPVTDGAGHVVVSSTGEILPNTAQGILALNGGVSAQAAVAFAPGTKMQYLDEYIVGFEHEFSNSGVIFSARYTDRRIKRIVEDLAALSPEAAQAGLPQQYFIGNPSKTTDYFTNPQQVFYVAADQLAGQTPCGAESDVFFTQPSDSNGNGVTLNGNDSVCITPGPYSNGAGPGDTVADGVADGFVNPARVYKAVEFEVNKSFSKGWQMRANYRIARLVGNDSGTFRNDNTQSDPNISSLFDFTRGDLNLLGQQFVPGILNQDVHHTANGFLSYVLGSTPAKGLTLGTSVHFQTGIPINNLYAHPVYANAGEIPFCADDTTNCASARGSLGRTSNWGSVDAHVDYPFHISESKNLRFGIDLFNISNNRTLLRVDQQKQLTVGLGNADFGKPTGGGTTVNPGYQRPFYARMMVKFEF